MNADRAVTDALADVLAVNAARLRVEPVGASSFVQTALAFVDDERVAFVKHGAAPAGFFAGEAAGLRALTGALMGTRASAAEVLACSDAFLAVRHVSAGAVHAGGDSRDDVAFGEALVHMHATSDARGFGFDCTTFCGATPLDNRWSRSWPEVFIERRWRPLVDRVRARGDDVASLLRAVPAIARAIAGAPLEDSALVHGDLWSGNVLTGPHGPVLIDPAASFAHREYELGMATLFGGMSARALAAYRAARPLADGWEARVAIYRAWHLLNHAALFGGGYLAQAERTLADALAVTHA